MKALIFAAGLGTRLKPLTDNKPKALVEINGKTLLELVIQKLVNQGFNDIIINVHHFSEMIKEFLLQKNNFNINIQISDETDQLLDTGGGLKHASWFFNDEKPFLVYNVDIFTSLDLQKLYNQHLSSKALATLAIRDRKTSRYFLFDNNLRLHGWENISSGEKKLITGQEENLKRLAFSGIQVLNPEIFKWINQTGKFSIVDVYLNLLSNHLIMGFDHSDTTWLDVGRPENIKLAEEIISKNS